ncbi:hypothetical protein [Sphingomonas sp. VDB2]|uniref:hypothetical protein n=1 Tax=Sphingomonas sp. VDB2 TaxID=3228751 RepID=UPI003A812360
MADTIYIGASFPVEHVEAMDAWRAAQDDPRLTRANVLEYFVAIGLGLEPPIFSDRKRPPTEAERDERAEHYCQLYEELGSYAAVGRQVGVSAGTVTTVIRKYEIRNSLAALRHSQRETDG